METGSFNSSANAVSCRRAQFGRFPANGLLGCDREVGRSSVVFSRASIAAACCARLMEVPWPT